MKKFFAAAMAAVMMGSLVSCGKDQADKGEKKKKKIGLAMPAEERSLRKQAMKWC